MNMRHTMTIIAFALLSVVANAQKKDVERPNSYNYNRAVELVNDDNPAEAVTYFKKELSDNPKNGYAYSWLSGIYLKNGELGSALASADMAVKYVPKEDDVYIPYTYNIRSRVYLELKDTLKALDDLKTGLRYFPDDEDLLEVRAQIYYEQDKYDMADKDYAHIVEIAPSSVMGYMGLGRNATAKEQYVSAIAQFDKVLQLYSDYGPGYSYRAEAYFKNKQYDKAAEDVVKCLSFDVNDTKGLAYMHILADSARNEIVARIKVQALKEKKAIKWPYCLGSIHEHLADYKTAIEFYNKGLSIDALPVFEGSIASCYSKLGLFDKALEHNEKAYNLDQDDNRLVNKVRYLFYAGRVDEALATVNEVLDRNPEYDYGYKLRAIIKMKQGDLDAAIEDMTIATMLDPTDNDYYIFRSVLYWRQGNEEKRKADCLKILETDTIANSSSRAMYAYLGIGEKDKAKEFMATVLEKEPNSEGCFYDAACLYGQMGELEQAMEYLRMALEKGYKDFNNITTDYDMDVLRDRSDFKELIQKFRPQWVDDNTESQLENKSIISTEVPFTKEGGVCKVMCKINDLPLHFIFDTGASIVSISNVEATFMYKNGYINRDDILGRQNFVDANGDVSEGTIINLRRIDFGGLELENVRASVVRNQKAPLLLGQSVLGRLGKIEIDNSKQVIRITGEK